MTLCSSNILSLQIARISPGIQSNLFISIIRRFLQLLYVRSENLQKCFSDLKKIYFKCIFYLVKLEFFFNLFTILMGVREKVF